MRKEVVSCMAPLRQFTSKQRGNSASWIKNAAKSLGMVGIDVLKELNPTVSEITTSSMKTSQEIYKQVRAGNVSNQRVSNVIKNNRYVKLGSTAIKNALEDLKTGNFNNTERFEKSIFGGGDNSEMSFGDWDTNEYGFDDDGGGNVNIVETGLSEQGVAQLGEISTRNTEAILKATQAQMDASIGLTTATMMQVQEFGNKITSKLDTANNHLAALVEFNNSNMLRFIEASTAYYDQIGKKLTEDASAKKQKMQAGDVFLGKNGGINFQNYGELIKQQAKDYFENSQAGFAAGMIDQFGEALVANPLNMITKFAIESAIPEMVKTTMNEVDEAMSGAMVTMLQRLGTNWGNSQGNGIGDTFKRFVGKTFGINIKNDERIKLGGKVTGDPAVFDGYTHHTINELVPKYLRESTAYLKSIAEYLTGDSEKARKGAEVFDHQTGTYMTVDQVQKQIFEEIRDATVGAVKESAFGKAMTRAGMANGVDSSDYDKALTDFLYRLTVNGTPDFSNPNWMNTIDEILSKTSGSDNTKKYIRSAVEGSIKNRNSGATMSPGLLAGQSARNRTLREMGNNPTGYNLYATSLNGGNVDDEMARVLYANENGDDPDQHMRRHGSIADVLDNMNYLLERGINVHVTGKDPYPVDHGRRPNRRGIPQVIRQSTVEGHDGNLLENARNAASNLFGRLSGRDQEQEGENQEGNQNPNAENPEASLSEEEIQQAVNNLMEQNPENNTVGGLVGKFQKFGKGIAGGIYDILQGNFKQGFKNISSSTGGLVDPSGKKFEAFKDKMLGTVRTDANGEVLEDYYGNVVRDTSTGKFGAQGKKIKDLFGKARHKVKQISNMSPEEAKEGIMEFLFGHKVEDLPPQMLYKIYGKEVKAGQRLGSKNGVVRGVMDTFRDGMYGFYESFFGDKINPDDPPDKIKKQMLDGVKKKFKDVSQSIQDNMPQGLKDTLGTVKAGAGRGAAGGAIGFMLGGPLGAVAGSSVGIFTKSKMFQDFMYGEEDEETGKRSGGFKKKVMDRWDGFLEKHKIGTVDPETGKRKPVGKLAKMMATGGGLGLVASMFTPLGPVGGALVGITTGLVAGEGKVHDFLFGKKTKNENGEEEYERGLFARLGSVVRTSWIEPMKNTASDFFEDAKDFVKDNILTTIGIAFDPIANYVGRLVDSGINAIKSKMMAIGEGVSNVMTNLVDRAQDIFIRPIANFIGSKLKNNFLVRGAKKVVGGAVDAAKGLIMGIPAKMEKSNRKASLARYTRELEAKAAAGDVDSMAKLEAIQNNDPAAIAEAERKYYYSDFQERRKEQMEARGERKERNRVARGARDATTRNKAFISSMTGGRLEEDTAENREEAMAIFQRKMDRKRGKLFGKKKVHGYTEDFKFEEMDEETGNLTQVETAVSDTARSNVELVRESEQMNVKLDLLNKQMDELMGNILKKQRERKDNGEDDWDRVDDEDSMKMQQLQQAIERLKEQRAKAVNRERKEDKREVKNQDRREKREKRDAAWAERKEKAKGIFNKGKNFLSGIGKSTYEFLSGETWDEYQETIRRDEAARQAAKDRKKIIRDRRNENLGRQRYWENRRSEANSDDTEEGGNGSGRIRGYARGTNNATPGPHVVGELGPEILHIPKGAHVDPNDKVINVRISEIDKSGWLKFVKNANKSKEAALKMSIGSSEDIIPVYSMGTLGSNTANISRILGAVSKDANITTEMIDDDINDDKNQANGASGINGEKEDKEDKKGLLESLESLKNAAGNIKLAAAGLAAASPTLATAIPMAMYGKYAWDEIRGMLGFTDKNSNSNKNTYQTDENGNVILDEEGKPMLTDPEVTDKDLTIPERVLNNYAPKRTDIDEETGKATTRNRFTNESLASFNRLALGGVGAVRTGKAGAAALQGVSKVGKGILAKSPKVTEFLARKAKVVETAGGAITKFVGLVKTVVTAIIDTLVKLLSKTKIGGLIKSKLGPKLTKLMTFSDDVLKTFSTKISSFMAKMGAKMNAAFLAIEIGSTVVGGIDGYTTTGYMFDVDMDDPELDPFLKLKMTNISTALGAFRGTSIGAFIDLAGVLLGFDVYKWLGNELLDLWINGNKNAETLRANFEDAQADTQQQYEEYTKQTYDAYCENARKSGGQIMSYEDFLASDMVNYDKWSQDQNKAFSATVGDAVLDAARSVGDWFGKHKLAAGLVAGPMGYAIASGKVSVSGPKVDTSQALDMDAENASIAAESESGMGGFGGGVPYYSQNDPRWKNAGYGQTDGATMGEAGCGPTALAMAASGATGKNINPMQMANFAQKNGYRDETGTNSKFVQAVGNNLGLETKSTRTPNESFVHNELSKGKPVVLLGRDGGYGNSAFTKAGHYVVATGETPDGGLMINDPRGRQFSGKYKKEDVLGESARAWSLGGRGETPLTSVGALKQDDYAKLSGDAATSTGTGVTAADVIAIARNEIGYVEKASDQDIDVKEANPGNANRTKYGVFTGHNGDPWCCSFVMWCIGQAANGDKSILQKVIAGPITAKCSTLWSQLAKANRITDKPEPGDLVFYNGTNGISHVGIVATVSGNDLTTIEGNTSMPGGGGNPYEGLYVAEKKKKMGDSKIHGFARPIYDNTSNFQGIPAASMAVVGGVASDGSGSSTLSRIKNAIGGLAGFFTKGSQAIKNYFETGQFTPDDPETSEEVQYDENGNPISATGGAAVSSAYMDGVSPYQFDGNAANPEAAFRYFLDQGYSPAATAGIIGNLMAESGADMNPSIVQGNGKGPAAGIAQWENYNTRSSRWKEMADFAAANGKQWTDLGSQLQFIHHELQGSQKSFFKAKDNMANAGTVPTTYEEWKATDDLEAATRQFEGAFERAGKPRMDARLQYAKGAYIKFAGMQLKPKEINENTELTSVGDLRRQESQARQDTTGGMGGYGDIDSDYGSSYLDYDAMQGGYGPTNSKVESYTPSKPMSKQVTTAVRSTPQSTSSSSGDLMVRQMLQYLQAIAENTGVSASKLDYLKTIGTSGPSVISGGNAIIQAPATPQKPEPMTKSARRRNAERISAG